MTRPRLDEARTARIARPLVRWALASLTACALSQCASGRESSPAGGEPAAPARQGEEAGPAQRRPPSMQEDEPAWSGVVEGLRGRLVATKAAIPPSSQFEIALELENVGPAPLQVQVANPFALAATLLDASGATVEPTTQRMDVISAPRWVELPPSASTRSAVTIATEDGAAPAHLDLTTSVWTLAPGRYRLSAQYRGGEFTSPIPAKAWRGTLSLPPIDLAVEQSAGAAQGAPTQAGLSSR